MLPDPNASRLRSEIAPLLTGGRLNDAAAALRPWCSPQTLCQLATGHDLETALLAVRCLGLIGGTEEVGALVPLLGSGDRVVRHQAEDALWSIWLRASSETGTQALMVAMKLIDENHVAEALELLDDLRSAEPRFAEAHHQAALAFHALDRGEEAYQAYSRTVELNPQHFAALAGLGHLCAEREDLGGALHYYRRAVEIHPRLDGVSELLPSLEAAKVRLAPESHV